MEQAHGSNFAISTSLASIQYLSCDRIVTWLVRRLCSSNYSFSSLFQICDPTDIGWVVVKDGQILRQITGFSIAPQWLLVRSQIWDREVKERLVLHHLRTDHVTIPSELKYQIGAKGVTLKCRVFGGKTGPIAMVRVSMW